MVGWEWILEQCVVCLVEASQRWVVVSWSWGPCGRVQLIRLRCPVGGVWSVPPQVLQVMAIISELWEPHVTQPVGTVAVHFQGTAGN